MAVAVPHGGSLHFMGGSGLLDMASRYFHCFDIVKELLQVEPQCHLAEAKEASSTGSSSCATGSPSSRSCSSSALSPSKPSHSREDNAHQEDPVEAADEAEGLDQLQEIENLRMLIAEAEARYQELHSRFHIKTHEVIDLSAKLVAEEDALARSEDEKADLQQQLEQARLDAWTASRRLAEEQLHMEQALWHAHDALDAQASELQLLASTLQEQKQAIATDHGRYLQLQQAWFTSCRENADLVKELSDAEQAMKDANLALDIVSEEAEELAKKLQLQQQVMHLKDARHVQLQEVASMSLVNLDNQCQDLTHLLAQYQADTEQALATEEQARWAAEEQSQRASQRALKAAQDVKEIRRQAAVLIQKALRAAEESRKSEEASTQELRRAVKAKRAEDAAHAKQVQVLHAALATVKAEAKELEQKLAEAEDNAKRAYQSTRMVTDAKANEESKLALQAALQTKTEEAANYEVELRAAQSAALEHLNENQKLKSDLAQVHCELCSERETLANEQINAEQALRNASAAMDELLDQTKTLASKLQDQGQEVANFKALYNLMREELAELCSCPLSCGFMREPVLGTDLRTYEKDVIEQVLNSQPASPYTRAPMEKRLLRPNKLVADFLAFVAKHFPSLMDCTGPERPLRIPPVGDELILAMSEGKAEEVLELLSRDVDPKCLNIYYDYGSLQLNLLQLSICMRLPEEVALAIIRRPDFKRTGSHSNEGLLAIHMASAYNYTQVCNAIVDEMGTYALCARTLADAHLTHSLGRLQRIPKNSTALDCARLFGHTAEWAAGLM